MTFELRHYVRLANHRGASSVRRHSLTSYGISLVDFLSSKVIHAGQLCGLEEIVYFVRLSCVAAAILGKIANNVINGRSFDIHKVFTTHPVQFYPVKVSHVLYECQNRNAVRELVSFTVSIENTRLSYFLVLFPSLQPDWLCFGLDVTRLIPSFSGLRSWYEKYPLWMSK